MSAGRFVIALIASIAVSCGGAQGSHGTASGDLPGTAVAGAAPIALTLERADGETVDIATYRGRAVLIIAFQMDDVNSQATIEHADQVARAHPDDVAVIAITGDRHPRARHRDLARVFASVSGLQRTDVVLADDPVRDGASALGAITHVPTTFLVNRAGAIARRIEGYLTLPQFEALVGPALPPRVAAQ